jgi:hypothetical protein
VNQADLREEIAIELEAMTQVVVELVALQQDVAGREVTVREKTAAAAFLAQFYNGIENILKRISYYYGVSLPEGDAWHVELFQRFVAPASAHLPSLFDDDLAANLAPYRRFRHVVFHSYGFQLDWARMAEGVQEIQVVFDKFEASLGKFLQTLI